MSIAMSLRRGYPLIFLALAVSVWALLDAAGIRMHGYMHLFTALACGGIGADLLLIAVVRRLFTEQGERRRRRAGRVSAAGRAVARALKIFGTVLMLLGVGLFYGFREDTWHLNYPGRFVLCCSAFVVTACGYVVHWRGQQRLVTPTRLVEEQVSGVPDIPFALYLRSFDDVDPATDDPLDGKLGGPAWGIFFPTLRTQEQQFARALTLFTGWTVVAFGRPHHPNERVPGPVERLYYLRQDDGWKRVVGDLIHRAECVLLSTGETGGLEWEYQHVMADLAPERVVVLVTGDSAHYERFQALARQKGWFGGRALPEPVRALKVDSSTAIRAVLRFGDDWTATLVPVRIPASANGGQGGTLSRLERTLIKEIIVPHYRQFGPSESRLTGPARVCRFDEDRLMPDS